MPNQKETPTAATGQRLVADITDEEIDIHDAKAEIVNYLRRWIIEQGITTKAEAARRLDEKRETLSRILGGRVTHVSLDKLYRMAIKAGCAIRIDTPVKLQIGDLLSDWMSHLVDVSLAKLQKSDERYEMKSEAEVMDCLTERLAEYQTIDPAGRRIKMICSGKKWDLYLCEGYFERTAEIAKKNSLSLERVFVADPTCLTHARTMAQLSSGTGVPTKVFALNEDDPYPAHVPPPGVGFWIMGGSKIIMHTTRDDSYFVDVIEDVPLAAYLENAAFNPTKRVAEGDTAGISSIRE